MAERYDVLVVGAGPGGLAAASTAASHGARVGIVDMQNRAGGQVWRHDIARRAPRTARHALDDVPATVDRFFASQVIDASDDALLLEETDGAAWLHFDHLVLATGARELMLPFPGWTLPGVAGAGGLQALAKQGLPLIGKRVIVAGTGPLLLASAATLKDHGARVVGIFEQAPRKQVMALARGLWRWPALAMQAAQLQRKLAGVPVHYDHLVSAASGASRLQSVDVRGGDGSTQQIYCDYVGVGYGLVPNTELAAKLGCALSPWGAHDCVHVDALQRTSHASVFAVGEACGIGGLSAARLEGAIAAHAALGHDREAAQLSSKRDHARVFAARLAHTFALRPQVLQLASPETIVCRCEDVTLFALTPFSESRDAKLATRCGMGACQGRVCGTALAELGFFGRPNGRTPLFPARLASLATGTQLS